MSTKKITNSDPDELAELLIATLRELRQGDLIPSKAAAVSNLINRLLKVHEYREKTRGKKAAPVIRIPRDLLPMYPKAKARGRTAKIKRRGRAGK